MIKDSNYRKYIDHKGNAAKRGVDFLLTFEEWLDIWTKSGHYHERGSRRGQYCMSRYGDTGPYALGNIFIQLTSQNTSDAQNGVKDIPQTSESNLKRSKSMLGKNVGPKPKVQCPHCSTNGAMHNMVRYHFDMCKHK